MGILSKAWKGLKTGVKSIARGVKKAFKSFGKFMGKLGVLGQIAMYFVMPYVGAALGAAFTGVAQAASAYTGIGAGIVNAAGKVMTYASNAASTVGNTFSNITKGITDTLGNFAKTAGKKMGFTGDMFANASDNFFSAGGTGNGGMSAWEASTGSTSRFANVTEKFTTAIEQTVNESMPKVTEGLQGTLDDQLGNITPNSGRFDNIPGSVTTPDGIISQDVVTGITSPTIEGLGVVDSSISTATTFGNAPVVTPQINNQFGAGGIQDVTSSVSGSTGELISTTVVPDPRLAAERASFQPNYGPQQDTRSLLGKTRDYVTDKVSSGVDSITGFKDKAVADPLGTATDIIVGDDPAGKIRDTAVNKTVSTAINKLAYGDPEAPTYNSYATYIPNFDTFGSGGAGFGAQPIMGARDFEQQVSNNASPYGYTAFQYNQYMSQYGTA